MIKNKEKETIFKIILSIIAVFTLYLYVWGTLIPQMQMSLYTKSVVNKRAEKLISSKFIFSPMTNTQMGIRRHLLESLQKTDPSGPLYLDLVNKTIALLEDFTNRFPYYGQLYLRLAQAYDLKGIFLIDEDSFKKADFNYLKAGEVFSNRQEIQYLQTINFLSSQKYSEAIETAKQAYDNDPRVLKSKYYYGLAMVAGGVRELDQAFDFLEESIDNDINLSENLSQRAYQTFFIYFYKSKNKANFLKTAERLVDLDPGQRQLYQQAIDYINKTNEFPMLNFEFE